MLVLADLRFSRPNPPTESNHDRNAEKAQSAGFRDCREFDLDLVDANPIGRKRGTRVLERDSK